MVATLSVQVREAGAELGAAARPRDGLPRGAGGPAPSVLPLLRPVARSELACVLCLLSLVSCLLSLLSLVSCVRTLVACVRHIWSAIFILRLHCPVTPHKNKWKKLFDIYLILPSFMASHFCSTKLENHKTILGILEQSESMSFLLSTSICHIKQDSTF